VRGVFRCSRSHPTSSASRPGDFDPGRFHPVHGSLRRLRAGGRISAGGWVLRGMPSQPATTRAGTEVRPARCASQGFRTEVWLTWQEQPSRVMRYYRAWEAAFEAARSAWEREDLYPAARPIELPAAENGVSTTRAGRSASSDRGAAHCCCAEPRHPPDQGTEVAENPTALRAAILADARTAEALVLPDGSAARGC